MAHMPNRQPDQRNRPIIVRPPAPRVRWRFRWNRYFWYPLVIATTLYLILNFSSSGAGGGLMDALRVSDRDSFGYLAALGLILVAITLLVRLGRRNREE